MADTVRWHLDADMDPGDALLNAIGCPEGAVERAWRDWVFDQFCPDTPPRAAEVGTRRGTRLSAAASKGG